MDTSYRFSSWFLVNWSRAGLVLAVFLLALLPFFWRGMSGAAFLAFLGLLIYIVHQYEEHATGAFKAYVNGELAKGRELLTDRSILWINIFCVWVVDLIVIYLAAYVRPALGLIAIYLTLFNGALHIGFALARRQYNPGLWTSLILFLPVGLTLLIGASHLIPLTWGDQAIGLAGAVVAHLLIGVFILLDHRMVSAQRAVHDRSGAKQAANQ